MLKQLSVRLVVSLPPRAQYASCPHLLVLLDTKLGLLPLARRDTTVEQNVDLTVRAILVLGQVKVCDDQAAETSSAPHVTALAIDC